MTGLCDEQYFDVEVLLPSGRMYALERSVLSESEALRPRKEHNKTCRVRFHLNIPPGIGARNAMERDSAMTRLIAHLRRHFKGYGEQTTLASSRPATRARDALRAP